MKTCTIDDLISAINMKNGFTLADVRTYRKQLRLLVKNGEHNSASSYPNYDALMMSSWNWTQNKNGFHFWEGLWQQLRIRKVKGFIG